MSKGSKQRPLAVSLTKFGENFEGIFGPRKSGEAPPRHAIIAVDGFDQATQTEERPTLEDVEQDIRGTEG